MWHVPTTMLLLFFAAFLHAAEGGQVRTVQLSDVEFWKKATGAVSNNYISDEEDSNPEEGVEIEGEEEEDVDEGGGDSSASKRADPGANLKTLIRPNSGGGPDVVQFGVYCKNFDAVNLASETFVADVVLTLRWKDPRAAAIIPPGRSSVSMSQRHAKKRIWIPDITVTNRFKGNIDTVSVNFNISGDTVTQVQRSIVKIAGKFTIDNFPFDSQDLKVILASEALMLEELQLLPIDVPEATGIDETIFENKDFYLTGVNTSTILDSSGGLYKSRGVFTISCKRHTGPYFQSILMPEILMLLVSYSCFCYPLSATFTMPRVTTALVSFLSLVNLTLRTTQIVPVRGGISWIGLFETNCQSLMFFSVFLNVFTLIVYHEFEEDQVANKIQKQIRWMFPVLAGCVLTLAAFMSTDFVPLHAVGALSQTVLITFILGFIGYELWQVRGQHWLRGLAKVKRNVSERFGGSSPAATRQNSGGVRRAQSLAEQEAEDWFENGSEAPESSGRSGPSPRT